MNTTNSNPKKELLLGASLDVLHQQSREWLETIAFWKDETKFFENLLDKKDNKKSDYVEILRHLKKIHENLFNYLADDIIAHEKFLARLIKGEKGISDEQYREKHRNLNESMLLFETDFKEFKKMVFDYVKISD